MIDLLEDVHMALGCGANYLALMGALTLPDICSSLVDKNGLASRKGYISWFDKWLTRDYEGFFTGKECYKFRCNMLHQAITGDQHTTYKKILFVVPGSTTNFLHKNIFKGALNLDLPTFCTDVTSAVHRWMESVANTEPFRTNLDRLVRTHPNGIQPHMISQAVIG